MGNIIWDSSLNPTLLPPQGGKLRRPVPLKSVKKQKPLHAGKALNFFFNNSEIENPTSQIKINLKS